jgi:mycofactocin precursor
MAVKTSAPQVGTPPDDDVVEAQEAVERPAAEPVEELLVEEVSIDGMCGVY